MMTTKEFQCAVRFDEYVREGVRFVELSYPRTGPIRAIEVCLNDVRATDSIRVVYDFDRDGWAIQRAKLSYVQTGDSSFECHEEWIEVHFSGAWHFGFPEYP